MNPIEPLEKMWGEILSRDTDLVLNAFAKLDLESQKNVYQHLRGMIREKGWYKEQRTSARFALKTIRNRFPKVNEL